MTESCDVLVIGGGFYGLYLAEYLARRFERVVVVEREDRPLQRASYHNQARVHNGCHYPRSILTAARSRLNFPRFVAEFRPAIDRSFEQYYAIARRSSKTSAEQFVQMMKRIGAPLEPAARPVARLFDPQLVEAVFRTIEHAFDADVLRNLMSERVQRAGVDLRLQTAVSEVRPAGDDTVETHLVGRRGESTLRAGQVFCCGYSQLNQPTAAAGVEPVPLKHELTELALVEPPEGLRHLGITLMDGPFFSCMPFPAENLHSLSHVLHTPHCHWHDDATSYRSAYEIFDRAPRQTAFPHMIRDAARYLPALAGCRYVRSLWEVKTVLPRSEMDDSRPILLRLHHGGIRNYHLVMGGKIDNVYDVLDVLERELESRRMKETTSSNVAQANLAATPDRADRAAKAAKIDVLVSVVVLLQGRDDQTAVVADFIREAHPLLDEHFTNFEILLMDNATGGGTQGAIGTLLSSFKCVRYLRLARPVDRETALTAGLDAAIGDYVVTAHADFDPPSEMIPMIESCRSGHEVVIGQDLAAAPPGWLERRLEKVFLGLCRWLFGLDFPLGTTEFRVLSRSAVNALTHTRTHRRHFSILAADIGLDTALHPYTRISRSGVHRQRSLLKEVRSGLSILVHHSALPLRLVSLTGLLGSGLSFVYSLYVVAIYLFKPDVQQGWTTLSLQVSGLFMLAFLMLALLGECVGRLMEEGMGRPLYHVRDEQSSAVMLSDLTRRNVTGEPESLPVAAVRGRSPTAGEPPADGCAREQAPSVTNGDSASH